MRKTPTLAIVTAAAISLSACATSTPNSYSAVNESELSNVERYQMAVESNARRRGLDVRWVNRPDEDDLDEYEMTAPQVDDKNGDGAGR